MKIQETVKKVLALGAFVSLTGCQMMADKYIESYFERKGDGAVEKAIDKIVKRKREEASKAEQGPPLAERMKNPITVNVGAGPIKGDKNAPVTIVEFSDFQCPFCSRVLPTVDQVMKDYAGKVNLTFKHNPLPFHPEAMPAAKASMAAHKQGKFWEMHDKLFNNQRDLKADAYKKFAKDLKLDAAKFEKDMKDATLQKSIEEDANFARQNGAGGTPSFFIGKPDGQGNIKGVLLVGAQPPEKFKEVIDAFLKAN